MDCKHFAKRRTELMQLMGDGIAIVPTAPQLIRNRDVHFPFRADSDFLYLTGFAEPEALAVLVPGRVGGEFLMFCRPRDPERETWDGRRAGPEGVISAYGADQAFPISELDSRLPALLENQRRVFYSMGRHADLDQRILGWLNEVRGKARSGVAAPAEFLDLDQPLHELRLIKHAEEIRVMRRAARISAEGHRRAMRAARPGGHEYELEAELLYAFRHEGSQYPAYPAIVGGGANGCILHYVENNAPLRDGDLVLIDAAAELDGYASDITRTFPVNGHFTGPQRAAYEVVLAAQEAAIAQVVPGKHWNDPHDTAVRVLTAGLVDLGLLTGSVDGLLEQGSYRAFYMHRTGHWLGLDVHDVGDYKVDGAWRELEPGMVLTVEPGLYITPAPGVDERFWNIGIRIEDDVLVTHEGPDVLSSDAPKTVADIETLMARPRARSR